MSQLPYINQSQKDEHIKEANAKRVGSYVWDTDNLTWVRSTGDSSGNTNVSVSSSSDFEGGQITVGVTEVEVIFTGTTKSILIESDCNNSGFIFVGKTGVTTSTAMAKLEPGSSLTIELNDSSNSLYLISDTAGQTVRKLALI